MGRRAVGVMGGLYLHTSKFLGAGLFHQLVTISRKHIEQGGARRPGFQPRAAANLLPT